MKIIYIYPSIAIKGGVERILIDKMNYLVNVFGYDIYMITSDQGNHEIAYPLDNRVNLLDLDICFHSQYRYRGFRRIIKAQRLSQIYKERLKKAIREISPDIICCTTFQDIHSLLKIKGNIPLVVESHVNFSHPDTMIHHLQNMWNHYWIGKADVVVTLTENDALDWKRVNKNVYVIPNMVHLNETDEYGSLENKRAIFVGRLVEQKGLPELLTVWNLVHQRYPDWQLDIYGEGELTSVSDINLFVHAPDRNIFDRYKESSMMLLTSVYEPFGLVMPEAMSCGIPVVAFDCPYGPATIVTDGEDGFLVKNRDCQVFADRVCQLIEDENLRQCMGKKAIQSSQRYTADKIMPMWKELFEKLTSLS